MTPNRPTWGALALVASMLLGACLAPVGPVPDVTAGDGMPSPTVVAAGADSPPARATPAPAYRRPAHDFSLPNLEGNAVRLSELEGQVVLLNFWTTW
jgi:hypothetical protein